MGLRYEVYSLPWDTGGFKKRFFWLPVVEGSGRGTVEFLTTSGDGSVDIPLDGLAKAGRALTEIVSDTTSSLIRVVDCLPDGTNTIIDEWVCERPAREHADSKTVTISGPKLKAKIFDGQTFPAQDGLNPTKNPDHIFAGDNILQNPGFEEIVTQSSIYQLFIDATAGDFTLSIGSGNTAAIPFDENDGGLEGAIEDITTGIADDVSVTPIAGAVDVYRLSITAESGDFTLSDGIDDTSAIAFNASAATIETRIVTDITAINDVDVVFVNDPDGDYFTIEFIDPVAGTLEIDTTNLDEGSASLTPSRTATGFQIEFIVPAIANLTVNPSGLTGSASVVSTQEGQELSSGWTISQQVSAGTPRPYGSYDAFEVSTAQAHSGTSSIFIDPAQINSFLDTFAGVQQVVGVEPGQLYQASIWVYATAPGQSYRLVIRGIDEDLISKPLFKGNISPPANVWTQIVLSDIQIEKDSQVIFRFANINLTGNPAGFYVDDAYFVPGFAASTWGHIVNYFMDLKPGEFDWVDYSSITDTLDSGGVSWSRVESITGYFGESYGQFWDKGVDLEYEWDLRPKVTPVGSLTHDLVWFGSGGMDDAPSVGLYPNASITGGDSLTRTPAYTKVRAEGSEGLFVEVQDIAAVTAFGPLEKHIRDTSLHSVESLTARANALLAYESANRNAVHFQMVEHASLPRPGTHFRVGDTVPMQLPPGLAKTSKRVQSFSYTNTFPAQYLVTGSRVYGGEAAAHSLLWRLWRRFEIPVRTPKAGAIILGAVGSNYRDIILADRPLAYWRLNEPEGVSTAFDETGNGHNGTYDAGVEQGVAGLIANDTNLAAHFLGTSSSVNIPITSDLKFLDADYTLELWCIVDGAIVGDSTLFGWTNGPRWSIGYNTSSGVVGFLGQRAGLLLVSSDIAHAYDIPYHVVVAYNAGNDQGQIWVNGIQRGTRQLGGAITDGSTVIRIGRDTGAGSPQTVDEVAVYDYVLTPAQILTHYLVGSSIISSAVPVPVV